MDDGSLVKVLNNARSVNSQLMKTNLSLLMSIRETDCEIHRAKEILQKYHLEIQERGMRIGSDCSVQPKQPLISDDRRDETSNQTRGSESVNEDDDDQNSDSSSDSSRHLKMTTMEVGCPECLKLFPVDDDSFTQHLSTCFIDDEVEESTLDYKHCMICFKFFDADTNTNDILFHKEECERINGAPRKLKTQKRRRGSDADKASLMSKNTTTASSSEFDIDVDALCYICGSGERQLIGCNSTCSRYFHVSCIEENPSLMQRRGQATRKTWKCGECFRNIHTCLKCGFLGDDNIDIFPCSVPNCGVYFHDRCMDSNVNPSTFKCSRHVCLLCKFPDDPKSISIYCYRCPNMVHKYCDIVRPLRSRLLDKTKPTNPTTYRVGKCQDHIQQPLESSLRTNFKFGDIVLVLDFGNEILPAKAKLCKGNQWGHVVEMDDSEETPQQVSVQLFACGTTLVISSQFLLGVVGTYSPTLECIESCISNHVHAELNVQNLAFGSLNKTQTNDAILESCVSFRRFGRSLRVKSSQAIEYAKLGYKTWNIDINPHDYLDTRRRQGKLN